MDEFPCPKCGKPIIYRETKKRLKCRNCGLRVRAKPFSFEIEVAPLRIPVKSEA